MSKIIQVVKDIKKDTVKSGKNIGKPYYKLLLDNGETVFAWSWPIIKDIKKGQAAVLVVEKGRGDFLTVKEAAPINESIPSDDEEDEVEFPDDEEGGEEEVEKASTPGVHQYKDLENSDFKKGNVPQSVWEQKDARISRMSCVKSAVEYLSYCKPFEGKFKPMSEMEVIEIAKIFERYVNTGTTDLEE